MQPLTTANGDGLRTGSICHLCMEIRSQLHIAYKLNNSVRTPTERKNMDFQIPQLTGLRVTLAQPKGPQQRASI
jgi:hypothetical protein